VFTGCLGAQTTQHRSASWTEGRRIAGYEPGRPELADVGPGVAAALDLRRGVRQLVVGVGERFDAGRKEGAIAVERTLIDRSSLSRVPENAGGTNGQRLNIAARLDGQSPQALRHPRAFGHSGQRSVLAVDPRPRRPARCPLEAGEWLPANT
jgi:hypothetical protein